MTIAGVLEHRSGHGGNEPRRLLTALYEPGGKAYTSRHGPLTLAWTSGTASTSGHNGGAAPDDDRAVCLLAGNIDASPYIDVEADRLRLAELIPDLYRRHGDRLFNSMRGNFAVVIYDPAKQSMLLACDQLGEQAIYWHYASGRLVFGSEIRNVLGLLPSTPAPDQASLAHWLSQSMPPDSRTLYDGVHRLLPANVLSIDDGAPRIRRYWGPDYRSPQLGSREEHVAALRDGLVQSVDRRCRPHTTTAILLSGGLDSSSVAGLASGVGAERRPGHSYSATFPGMPTVDEDALISLLCDHLDLGNTRAVVRTGSVLSGAVEYLEYWKQPPPSPNLFFWLPLLRRAAEDGARVLLDGEGGDELFGLSPYLLADRLRRGRVGAALDLARKVPGGRPDLTVKEVWPLLRTFGLKGATPHWIDTAVRRHRGRATPQWLSAPLRETYFDTDQASEWKQLDGPLWWRYLVSATTRQSAGTYDHVRRRAAMAGLSASHPLVDVDVVEAALSIPPELAFDSRHSRPLFRETTHGLLPDEVRLRPTKSTFDAVFHDALCGPDLPVARGLLAPSRAELASYVDLEVVASALLDAVPPSGKRLWWALDVWRLLTAECWLRQLAGRPIDPAVLQLADADLEITRRPKKSRGALRTTDG